MNHLWTLILLLASMHVSSAFSGGPHHLQRLARLALPYGGPRGAHSLALARSVDALAHRRHAAEDAASEPDFEDDDLDMGKRQFDDYGHMRFGRSVQEQKSGRERN